MRQNCEQHGALPQTPLRIILPIYVGYNSDFLTFINAMTPMALQFSSF